jgi:hypothetical protein
MRYNSSLKFSYTFIIKTKTEQNLIIGVRYITDGFALLSLFFEAIAILHKIYTKYA